MKLIASNQITLTNVSDGNGLANATNFYLASDQSTGIGKPAEIFNLIRNGAYPTNTQYWSGSMIVSQHNFYYEGQKKLFLLQTSGTSEIGASSTRFDVKRNTNYTLSFYAFASGNTKNSDVYFLGRKSNETNGFTSANAIIYERIFLGSKAEYVTVTFNSGDNDSGYIRFDNNGSTDGKNAVMFFGEVMLVEGKEPKPWVASILDSGWTTTPQPISNDKRFLWNYRIELYTDGTTKATDPAVIGVYGDKGDTGPQGPQGPNGDSTGIAISDTEPSTKYVNMLWKHTGNVSGLITGATYRWTGSKWELYLFTAANITTENLAAITANLGTVTAGTVKGTTIEMSLDDNQIAIGTNNRTPNTIDATEGLVVYGTNGYSSAISSQGTVYELSSDSTFYQMWVEPTGLRFAYYISSSNNGVRYFNATSNGFEFRPTPGATGIDGNTGIDLKGQVTYVDFHWEIETTADYRTRLQQENGKFTIDSPYSNLLLKGGGEVRILTPGVNVRNYADSAWAPVNASGFGQQSDSQYKYNIKDMPDRLNELMGLEFKAYRLWGEDGKYQEGLLADKNYQQPFVNRGKDGDYNIDMYGYTTFLAKSLQEAVKRLEILENASRNGQSSGTTIDTSETTVTGERNAESS